MTKIEKYFCKNYRRIWSYRALVNAILYRSLRSIVWAWSQGSGFSRRFSEVGFLCCCWVFREVAAKCPENNGKASGIIEKSTGTSAKQCISKEKFKQSLKVHTKCAKSVNKLRYVKILHLGGSPPRFRNNILTYRSLFTLFAHFVCTFKLCLNFSFEIHWKLRSRLIFQ